MGWANCGTDSKGRPIGYAHSAECDHPGCSEKIDRGLAYACGGMHGEGEFSCEGYFCPRHLLFPPVTDDQWEYMSELSDGMVFCPACIEEIGNIEWESVA